MLSGSKSKPNIDNFGCVRAEIEEIHKEQSLGLSLPSGVLGWGSAIFQKSLFNACFLLALDYGFFQEK